MTVTRTLAPTRTPRGVVWSDLKAAVINSGVSPWDFDAVGNSAGGTTSREATAPTPYEGAGYLKCTVTGADGINGFSRGQFTIARPIPSFVRSRFAVFLPTGYQTSIIAGGTSQLWRLDAFPTSAAYGVNLLFSQPDNDWRLVCRDNSVDTDITGRFSISENAWHYVEIQIRLALQDGWCKIWRDGALVATGDPVKTIYNADDGSGAAVSRNRIGLVAFGTGQVAASTCYIDAVDLDVFP